MSAPKKEIIFQNILACQTFTDDEYWKTIIYNCARNKIKGMRYDKPKNILQVRYDVKGKVQNESIFLPSQPEEIFKILMKYLKDMLRIQSDNDISISKKNVEDMRLKGEVNLDCCWKKLKPRSIKTQILLDFSISEVKKHNLPENKSKDLFKIINLGFQFKKLTSNNVKYEKGVIVCIKGLEFNSKRKVFELTSNVIAGNKNTKQTTKSSGVKKDVERWLKDYKNHYNLKILLPPTPTREKPVDSVNNHEILQPPSKQINKTQDMIVSRKTKTTKPFIKISKGKSPVSRSRKKI